MVVAHALAADITAKHITLHASFLTKNIVASLRIQHYFTIYAEICQPLPGGLLFEQPMLAAID
jgi:hypothetical protein